MPRPRSARNSDLPPRLIRRERRGKVRYYYQHPDKRQEPLGENLQDALKKWGCIYTQPEAAAPGTFSTLADEFIDRGMAKLAIGPKTQQEYRLALTRLKKVFKHAPMETITPVVVGGLMDQMSDTPTQANRFKAALSRMWNWARSRGKTTAPNPCPDVEGFTEKKRAVMVTPVMFWGIHEHADQVLRDWMRLDVLIGQRVSDVLKVRRADIHKQRGKRWLAVRATKTETAGKIEIGGDLALLVDELLARKVAGPWLVQTDDGQRVTYAMLRNRFDAARDELRKTAPELANWQMRDLRKASLNQAKTLEEARRRGLHQDAKTTARHYELVIEATAGKMPPKQ